MHTSVHLEHAHHQLASLRDSEWFLFERVERRVLRQPLRVRLRVRRVDGPGHVVVLVPRHMRVLS